MTYDLCSISWVTFRQKRISRIYGPKIKYFALKFDVQEGSGTCLGSRETVSSGICCCVLTSGWDPPPPPLPAAWAHPRRTPANTRCWPNAGLTVVQCRRRWANIKPALDQRLVFAETPPNVRDPLHSKSGLAGSNYSLCGIEWNSRLSRIAWNGYYDRFNCHTLKCFKR